VLLSACATTQPDDDAQREVVLLRGDTPASAGSDGAALPARVHLVADHCVGAVASGRTYLIRFPSDTTWDGDVVLIPGSPGMRIGDDVVFGGNGRSLEPDGQDADVPAACESAADEIWYVGGARLD
jgi:hypothetical protein